MGGKKRGGHGHGNGGKKVGNGRGSGRRHRERIPTPKYLRLSICLSPEDDLPHPRHLCFFYPFDHTSPHLHCQKCYCYVCGEIAPCKKWSTAPRGHCHADDKEEIWTLEREWYRKALGVHATNCVTEGPYKLVISIMCDPPGARISHSFIGVLIEDEHGRWMTGYSIRMLERKDSPTLPIYVVILEGLQLAWSRGFKSIEILLGFASQGQFWDCFSNKDGMFSLLSPPKAPMSAYLKTILQKVESYLNWDWHMIDVKDAKTFKEELGAYALSTIARRSQVEEKEFYDHFPSHPLTPTLIDIALTFEAFPWDRAIPSQQKSNATKKSGTSHTGRIAVDDALQNFRKFAIRGRD